MPAWINAAPRTGKVFFAFALIGITVIVSGVWVYGDILAVRQATIARGHSYEVLETIAAAAVEEQGAATEEIARNVQQAAQGTNDVTVNIVTVNRAAATTGKAATEMLETAGELTRQSGILNTEVANFVQRLKTA